MIASLAVPTIAAVTAAAAAVGGACVGLIFRGAAAAWREERDAAVDKADRLEVKVDEQAREIDALKTKVGDLEKRTDYEAYAKQSRRDHEQILKSLSEITRGLQANTTAVEFLIKQAFPAAAFQIQP